MGNVSSKIAQPLLDAASSLLRRMQIWKKFQALVQRITGSAQTPVAVAQPASQYTPQQEEEETSPPQHIAEDGSGDDARDDAEDDILVGNITRALEDAAPLPSALSTGSEQPDNEAGVAEGEHPSEVEQLPTLHDRETYDRRIDGLHAVYGRLDPGSKRPGKPKTDRDVPRDDYDNQVAEYVFSTLMVALPEPPHSKPGTGVVFRPPIHNDFEDNPGHPEADLDSTGAPDHTDSTASDGGPSDPEEEAMLTNFRTWDRQIYAGLRLDRSSIRLVGIMPGAHGDNVSVRMDVHRLKDVARQYEALSYVWGNPQPAKNIFVNDVEVPVNPNLYDALVSLRQPDSIRRIWIDAICLNQTSFAEKSKEVQKMGQIYSLAKTVVIFLGAPGTPGTDVVGSFLKFLNRDDTGKAAKQYAQEGWTGLHNICMECQLDVHSVCMGFLEACLQPWWGRVWTLQEFYLAEEEPIWYWGNQHASNAFLKRDFDLLMDSTWNLLVVQGAEGRVVSDLSARLNKPIGSFKVDVNRISALISRRYSIDGFDTPRRLYRELTARATNPRDFVYGLRAIFDPVFGRVFVPDYAMRTELLFSCLAVFLIQFECWGDVLWWYPSRYSPGQSLLPSWLPNFTQHVMPHEYDVVPLSQIAAEKPEPKLAVLNHRLHAEGYVLDTVYAHRHVDKNDEQKIFAELWQFDHCMNHNHECHEIFLKGAAPEDHWLGIFIDMYNSHYATQMHFVSAFRGALIQSAIKPEDGDKLPRQIAQCVPSWDVLRWHALRTALPGLVEALGQDIDIAAPGCLENIFSPRMDTIFRDAFVDFFIGACIFDWGHISVWLNRFPNGTQWSKGNDKYWSDIRSSMPDNVSKRTEAIMAAYSGYEREILQEVIRHSWCYSFYYAFLAYVILLDCDDHASLVNIITKLQAAGNKLRSVYASTSSLEQVGQLAAAVPSVAARVRYWNTIADLFRGRILFWTNGGFRGTSCPGVETCTGDQSVVAIVDGLSFPVIVRDYDEKTGEGWLAGCAVIRGVDMLSGDTEQAVLPPDYEKGERKVFKLR